MSTKISQIYHGFSVLDRDYDGFITVLDLKNYFREYGADLSSAEIEEFLWSWG